MKYITGGQAPARLPVLTEEQIKKNWRYMSPPLVSVHCATYNHGKYIEDAIAGFLGQKTNFPFEVIIRDDASTDGTSEIVKKYAESHRGIVRAIIEKENRYPYIKAGEVFRKHSQGTYVASCEGDDYWIDPDKLQKQVDLIQSDGKISLVASYALHIENGVITGLSTQGGTRTYLSKPTPDFPFDRYRYIYFGDSFQLAALSAVGKIIVVPEVTAVWRKHPGGVWSSLLDTDNPLLQMRRGLTQFWLSEYFLKNNNRPRARTHLVNSVNFFIDAYPDVSSGAKLGLVLQWITPKWIIRAFGFLSRKLSSLIARF